MPSTVRYDTDDQYRWSEIWDTTDDETGELLDRFTLYDTYLQNTTFYSGGVRTWMIDSDPSYGPGQGLVAPWSRIETYFYQDGTIAGRETTYDDERVKVEQFQDGVRSLISETDAGFGADGSGAYDWYQIDTYYNTDGSRAARVTEYDNGITREELFDGGQRSQTTQTDNSLDGTAAKWQRIDTYYEPTGQVLAKVTQFDNGIEKEELWQSGMRAQTSFRDDLGATPEGVANWTTRDIYYDNGEKIAIVTTFDDGREKEEYFANGLRTVTQETDVTGSAKPWEQIVTAYEQSGALAGRQTDYDDGTQRIETFQGGLRVQTVQTDNSVDGTAKSWQSITTSFDQNGVIAERTALSDSGITRTDSYFNGQRFLTQFVDDPTADAALWDMIVTGYNADGSKAGTEVTYDTGDRTITVFQEGGVRDYIVEEDRDGSDSWAVRVKEFDAAGQNMVVTTYDDLIDVPEPYIDALGYVSAI